MRRRVGRAAVVITATGHNRKWGETLSPQYLDSSGRLNRPEKETAAEPASSDGRKTWWGNTTEELDARLPEACPRVKSIFPTLVRPIRGTSGGV